MTTLDFSDRVVVITGAGRGIGRAHAELLASLGAAVVVGDLGATIDVPEPKVTTPQARLSRRSPRRVGALSRARPTSPPKRAPTHWSTQHSRSSDSWMR